MATPENNTYNLRHDLEDLGIHYHHDMIDAIINYLGPSMHNEDASLIACSDAAERTTVKENFLIGKLGLDADDPKLDGYIEEICHTLGKSNTKKHRATFYYLLTAKLGKESVFIGK